MTPSSDQISAPDILTKMVCFVVGLFQLLYWYMEALYRQIIPPPMKCIDGETILVTGAVGGIGREICRQVTQSGSNIKLVLWDLNELQLKIFAEELREIGHWKGLEVFPFAVDISSRENINECCQKVKDRVGPVTIIFNNAGIMATGNFLMLSDEQIDSSYQINLISHLWILRQFLPKMISKNHGRIVNICSFGGVKAAQHALPYFSSKFAVNGYTEALKMELEMFKIDGVHVTTVYPYIVKTPMIKTLEVNKEASHFVPSSLLTFLEPKDVARKTVDGMRREYEYIYLPRFIPLLLVLEYFIPMKVQKIWQTASYTNYFTYTDAKDQMTLSTPFSTVTNGHKNDKNTTEMRRNTKSA